MKTTNKMPSRALKWNLLRNPDTPALRHSQWDLILLLYPSNLFFNQASKLFHLNLKASNDKDAQTHNKNDYMASYLDLHHCPLSSSQLALKCPQISSIFSWFSQPCLLRSGWRPSQETFHVCQNNCSDKNSEGQNDNMFIFAFTSQYTEYSGGPSHFRTSEIFLKLSNPSSV